MKLFGLLLAFNVVGQAILFVAGDYDMARLSATLGWLTALLLYKPEVA